MKIFFSRFGFAAISLSLSFVLLLAGCGGGDSPQDGRSKEGKTVLKFWHFWSEPTQKAALMERVKAFEAENPDLYVELSELSWNDGQTKLQLAFNSGTAPDVLELGSDWVAQFSSAGVLANQKGMAGDNESRFSAEVLAPGQWNGGAYAWPWVVDSRVLYFNKALLASVGADTTKPDTLWSDVLAKAEQIKAKHPDAYGFGANGPDRHRLYKKIVPFFWSNGGQVVGANGTPAMNSPQNIQALEAYLELARTGLIETQKALDQQFVGEGGLLDFRPLACRSHPQGQPGVAVRVAGDARVCGPACGVVWRGGISGNQQRIEAEGCRKKTGDVPDIGQAGVGVLQGASRWDDPGRSVGGW
ncbi:MAG: extracellular solute-binding protein [Chlorobi bacterium]|nr:extracellular solute-binding protein [Chlorobiota bacterium]